MKYLFVFLLVGLTSVVNAQTEKAKQPNCDDIEGIRTTDLDLLPNDYTGVAFKCIYGKVEWLYNYKDGKLDGIWRTWSENGQLSYEGNSKNSKADGIWRGWYENGQLKFEDYYIDGQKDGLWRWWHTNGQLAYEMNYKNGVLISEKCYDMHGNLQNCK